MTGWNGAAAVYIARLTLTLMTRSPGGSPTSVPRNTAGLMCGHWSVAPTLWPIKVCRTSAFCVWFAGVAVPAVGRTSRLKAVGLKMENGRHNVMRHSVAQRDGAHGPGTDARDIAPGPCKARNKSLLDCVVDAANNNGSSGRGLHCGANRGSRRGDDHIHFALHEIGSESG